MKFQIVFCRLIVHIYFKTKVWKLQTSVWDFETMFEHFKPWFEHYKAGFQLKTYCVLNFPYTYANRYSCNTLSKIIVCHITRGKCDGIGCNIVNSEVQALSSFAAAHPKAFLCSALFLAFLPILPNFADSVLRRILNKCHHYWLQNFYGGSKLTLKARRACPYLNNVYS